jgi:hypothetical protein
MALQKQNGGIPAHVGRHGVAALPVSQLTRRLSAMRRLNCLLQHITSLKHEVSEMVPLLREDPLGFL